MKTGQRLLCLMLCGAVLVSFCSPSAFAKAGIPDQGNDSETGHTRQTISADGLCEHHSEHTEDCGYVEGKTGTPCAHEHTEDCYDEVIECIHEHNEDCYPQESVLENSDATANEEEREPENCTHVCRFSETELEESGCITKKLNCRHEHDGDCGYQEEIQGSPCAFVCEICGGETTKNDGNDSESGTPETETGEETKETDDEQSEKPGNGQEECVCEKPCKEDGVNKDCPVCSAEDASLSDCKGKDAEENTEKPEHTGTCRHHQEHDDACGYQPASEEGEGSPCTYDCRVCPVQELIDALPAPEDITADSAEEVAAQLAVIDEAGEALTEEELAMLDFARYEAVMLALAELMDDTPAQLATESNITYLDCDDNGKNWQTRTCVSATVVESDVLTWGTEDAESWYVVNNNVMVDDRITVSGDVRLILKDGCELTAKNPALPEGGGSTNLSSGINVGEGNSLTIYAQSTGGDMGRLFAMGGGSQSGIGGGSGQNAGTIIINGGSIRAESCYSGTGIGGGEHGSGGLIRINAGNITAIGAKQGFGGSGIGGGNGWGTQGGSGIVEIHGGIVNATGGWMGGAGIGGWGDNNSITITGGTVTAQGGNGNFEGYGAGIGGGDGSKGGNVTITGGTVVARGYGGSAGIGGGKTRNNNYASDCTFYTGGGNAVIIASDILGGSVEDKSAWSGVIFEGDDGKVYGTPVISADVEIPAGKTLQIEAGKTLTIAEGVTLTNNGTIYVVGTLTNDGIVVNNGTMDGASVGRSGVQVTYDANGGSDVTPGMIVSIVREKYQVPESDPARTGYTFAGWYTEQAEDAGEKITGETTVTKTGSHTLYAHWTANRYTVTFDANGGSVVPASKQVIYDSAYGELPVPTGNGESPFVGWYTETGGGTQVTKDTKVTITADQTLYARWAEVVLYLDASGAEKSAACLSTVGQTVWGAEGRETWYVVDRDTAIDDRITVKGDVHLILKDNAKLTAPKGIAVDEGNSLTIYCQSGRTGALTAGSDNNADAAIGGGETSNAGSITINGGVIEAKSSGDGAGIGGGHANDGQDRQYGKFQSITINGGKVSATSGRNGAGIGCGCWAKEMGTIRINGGEVHASTAARDGRAYDIGWAHRDSDFDSAVSIIGGTVFTEGGHGRGIGATTVTKDNCVVFAKNAGQVYGSAELDTSYEIPEGTILTVPENAVLTIPDGVILTNNGAIRQYGTINGKVAGNQPIRDRSMTTVILSSDTVDFGKSVTITATIAKAGNRVKSRSLSAGLDKVNFYVGTGDSPALLGTVAVEGNTASYTLQPKDWNHFSVGENTITVVFGDNTTQKLLGSAGTAVLTVNATEFDGTLDLRHGSITITKMEDGKLQIRQDGRETRIIDATDSITVTSGGVETPNTITVDNAKVSLILSDVKQGEDWPRYAPLYLKNGADVDLTLQGENTLAASGHVSEGIEMWENCSLTVNGPGTLNIGNENTFFGIRLVSYDNPGSVTVNGGTLNITAQDVGIGASFIDSYGKNPAITINGGVVHTNVSDGFGAGIGTRRVYGDGGMDIKINGGTVELEGGGNKISARGEFPSESNSGGVTINGGSVKAGDISPEPQNGDGAPVYAVTVDTKKKDEEVESITLSGITYGSPAKTDKEGKMTLYLPAGEYDGYAVIGGEVVKLGGMKSEDSVGGSGTSSGTVEGTGIHITAPKGEKPTVNPDGTVDVPDGTIVKPGNGGPEVTVGPGNGGTVGSDGGITVPEGGSVTVMDKDGNTTIITPPTGGGTIQPNPDGTVSVPGGSTVEEGGKTATVPEGGGTLTPGSGTGNIHTVTYDCRGGSVVNSFTVLHGGKAVKPNDPTRSGYVFCGWYKENRCTNEWNFENNTVIKDVTLYAKWLSVNTKVTKVTIDGVEAEGTGTSYTVVLPHNQALPTDSGKVSVTTADSNAQVSNLQTEDSGKKWTFTVTAENGTTADYTINVSADPTHTFGSEWKSDGTNHWHECICGEKSERQSHVSRDDGDCTTAVKCLTCGYIMKAAQMGHSFTDYRFNNDATCTNDGTETALCRHEGCVRTDTRTKSSSAQGHDYKNTVTVPTCTGQGYTTHTCSCCGDSYTDNYTAVAGHSYGGWTEISTPACTGAEQKQRTCSACGYVETDIPAPAGHSWEKDFTVDKQPACMEDGSKSIHCSKCDAVKDSQTVPKLGHDYRSAVTAPTCTERGYTTHTCSRCGDSYTDTYINATAHSYGGWTVIFSSACTGAGQKQRTCSVCKYVETDIPAPAGHSWEKDFTVDKQPTCMEDGSKSIHCSKCDAVKDSQTLQKTNHNYSNLIAEQPATHDADGMKAHYRCSVCSGYFDVDKKPATKESLTIPKLAKEYTVTVNASPAEGGTVSGGGTYGENTQATVIAFAKSGYRFTEWREGDSRIISTATSYTFTVAGSRTLVAVFEKDTPPVPGHTHSWAEGWTTSATHHWHECPCGEKSGVESHNFGGWITDRRATEDAAGTKHRNCTICNYREDGNIPKRNPSRPHTHSYSSRITKAAACETKGTRTYTCACGDSYMENTAALGHDYVGSVTKEPTVSAEGVRTYTCSRCGRTYTEEIPKLPSPQHEHSYSAEVTKNPSCTEAGIRTYRCSCGDSYTEGIPAAEHSYSAEVTKEPTVSAEGVTVYTCERCGDSYTEPIQKLEATAPGTKDQSEAGIPFVRNDGEEESGSAMEPAQPENPDKDNTRNGQAWRPWRIIVVGALVIVMGIGVFFVVRRKRKTDDGI